ARTGPEGPLLGRAGEILREPLRLRAPMVEEEPARMLQLREGGGLRARRLELGLLPRPRRERERAGERAVRAARVAARVEERRRGTQQGGDATLDERADLVVVGLEQRRVERAEDVAFEPVAHEADARLHATPVGAIRGGFERLLVEQRVD